MSWAGGTFEFPVSMDKKEIEIEVNESLEQERGWRDPHFQPFVWKGNVCLDSYEDAEKWLEDADNMRKYWREKNVAIQYIQRERSEAGKKKEKELESKIKEIQAKKEEYEREHMASKTAHAYIGCPDCGSKLSSKHLHGNRCPLCSAELRSNTVLNTIKRYNERITEAKKAYLEEKKRPKRGDKVTKMWLIHAEAYLG